MSGYLASLQCIARKPTAVRTLPWESRRKLGKGWNCRGEEGRKKRTDIPVTTVIILYLNDAFCWSVGLSVCPLCPPRKAAFNDRHFGLPGPPLRRAFLSSATAFKDGHFCSPRTSLKRREGGHSRKEKPRSQAVSPRSGVAACVFNTILLMMMAIPPLNINPCDATAPVYSKPLLYGRLAVYIKLFRSLYNVTVYCVGQPVASSSTQAATENNEQTTISSVTPAESDNQDPVAAAESVVLQESDQAVIDDDDDCKLIHQPNQPVTSFPAKTICGTTRRFKHEYFEKFSWLHWEESKQSVFCYICRNIKTLGHQLLTTKDEGAFDISGFNNWKQPLIDFSRHERSAKHRECVTRWAHYAKGQTVESQLSEQLKADQKINRAALEAIVTSLRYLGRQGLSMRGHDDTEGNFRRLLELRSADSSNLKVFLSGDRRRHYLSHDIQNEVLSLMSRAVVKSIIKNVNDAVYYAVIADETTDIANKQQMCITLRWVDEQLSAHEDFTGMYEISDASASGLSAVIQDVLVRFGLNIANLRGQGYDGCSVMAGRDSGVAARIKQLEPRAVFVHCAAHSMNLAIQEAAGAVPMIRDCLSLVHKLVLFFKHSPTRSRILHDVSCDSSMTSLKPLCPTRWSVRARSVSSVLKNYEQILEALAEISKVKRDESGTKASGFLRALERFESLLGLRVTLLVFELIDDCNTSLQSKSLTLAAAKSLASTAVSALKSMRCESKFAEIFADVIKEATELDIGQPQLPRTRRVSRRIDSDSEAVQFTSADQFYRRHYFDLIDCTVSAVERRFDQPGMELAVSMEDLLLRAAKGEIVASDDAQLDTVTSFYTELDKDRLQRQLTLLPVSFFL